MHSIYIDGSVQTQNKGVGAYGDEGHRMQYLADRVKYYIETQKQNIEIFRNCLNMSMEQTVAQANALKAERYLALHTNATDNAKVGGTECYYHNGSLKGEHFAKILLSEVGPLSPGSRDVALNDKVLYSSGLYVLRKTTMAAALIENVYHTNPQEVEHYLNNIEQYAKANARAVLREFNLNWIEPTTPPFVHITINGEHIDENMTVKPRIIDGAILVPVRALMERLGYIVTWDDATRTANIKTK